MACIFGIIVLFVFIEIVSFVIKIIFIFKCLSVLVESKVSMSLQDKITVKIPMFGYIDRE